MKYGMYAPYWTHEWTSDYEYFIPKVKKLGFDVLEISCAALVEKYVTDAQFLELKKVSHLKYDYFLQINKPQSLVILIPLFSSMIFSR